MISTSTKVRELEIRKAGLLQQLSLVNHEINRLTKDIQ